jgi:hypothetical protein
MYMNEVRNLYKMRSENMNGKDHLGESGHRWMDNIKIVHYLIAKQELRGEEIAIKFCL